MAGETIVLGKNVTYTGISNVVEGSVTTTFTEIATSKSGDSETTIKKGWAEVTSELTCNDSPGVEAGSVVIYSQSGTNGHNISAVKFLVTSVSQSEPLDEIITYNVQLSRGVQ